MSLKDLDSGAQVEVCVGGAETNIPVQRDVHGVGRDAGTRRGIYGAAARTRFAAELLRLQLV